MHARDDAAFALPVLPVSLQEEGRHLQLQFQFRFTRDSEEVLFAFCFPYSYADCIKDLERFEDQARTGRHRHKIGFDEDLESGVRHCVTC